MSIGRDEPKDSHIKQSTDTTANVTYKRIWLITWPIIISNLSTPLLGLVDTAVIGNLGDAALIGAIALGAMVFSFLYWGFGFLRMGTTGLVAQALGANLRGEVVATLYRAILIGVLIGLLLIGLQFPLSMLAFSMTDGSGNVESAALLYFDIRIWSAPATLVNLAILGYFLGSQDSRTALSLQLCLNGINILLDLVFVVVMDWGVQGVASATLIAEYATLILGIALVRNHTPAAWLQIPLDQILDRQALRRALLVNSDIMIRTFCLIFAFAWFTNQGARASDVILAANALLMQFVSFAAFFLDGYALAVESLVGHGIGGQDPKQLRDTIKRSTIMSLSTAIGISLIFFLTGESILRFLTNVEDVISTALEFLPWVIFSPIIAVWCYLLDGIFIGATRTQEMRNAMLFSVALYFLAWWILAPLQNHGLWAALMIFFVVRSISLLFHLNKVFTI